MRCEVYIVVARVDTRELDAVMSAMDDFVIPLVELAMRSANTSSEQNLRSVVLDTDYRDSSGITDALQLTASGRMNSNTNIDGNNEIAITLPWRQMISQPLKKY